MLRRLTGTQLMSKPQNTLSSEQIVLASGSPRRRELLEAVGLTFEIIHPKVEEKDLDVSHLPPSEQVLALATFKGESVACDEPEAFVIAADTIVVIQDEVLGKPVDKPDAFRMLSRLQGRTHSVYSGIALFHQGQLQKSVLESKVQMMPLSEDEIWRYIETQEPMDKAGAYAIQGYGSLLIQSIQGCYFNVVGLSLNALNGLFKAYGYQMLP